MIAANRPQGSVQQKRSGGRYQKWFRIVVWAGILINLSFAVPAVFAPAWLLARMSLPPADQTIWLRDAGMLLFFLSAMYVPVAQDPVRYSFNAVVAVVARLVFAVFWIGPVLFGDAPAAYLLFGFADLGVGLAQAILLNLLRREDRLP